MTTAVDVSLVAVALLLSIAYAFLSLAPRALRSKLIARLSAFAAGAPHILGLRRISAALAAAAGKASKSGACGGCADCGTPAKSDEVRIPLSKIQRR